MKIYESKPSDAKCSKIKILLCLTAAICTLLCGCNSDDEYNYSSATELNEEIIENDAQQRIEIAEQSMNIETETQEQTLERLTPIESLLPEKEQDETQAFEEETTKEVEFTESNDTVPETEPQIDSTETETAIAEETVSDRTYRK